MQRLSKSAVPGRASGPRHLAVTDRGDVQRITTGAVFVDAITASDARLPFGGTKKSSYGRELAAGGVANLRLCARTGQRSDALREAAKF